MPDHWWPPPPRWSRGYPGFGALWRAWGKLHFWRKRPEVRFGLRFVLACAAAVAASTTTLTGLRAASSGSIVTIDGGAVAYDVTLGCTALFVGLLFMAAVVAFPSAWRPKLAAVALGIPLLLLCNVVRLVTMGWAGVLLPSLYESLHFVYWQALLVLFVSVGFYGWTRSLDRKADAASARWRRARRIALAGALFLAVVSCLWALGVWLGGIKAYSRALLFVVSTIQRAVWGGGLRMESDLVLVQVFAYDYAAAITLAALFAVSIQAPFRKRAWAFAWALPLTFLIQAVTWAIQLRPGLLSRFVALLLANGRMMVLPFAGWLLWSLALARQKQGAASKEKKAEP